MPPQSNDLNALLIAALIFSALAHLGSWFALDWVPTEEFTRLISEVEFVVVEEIAEEPPLPELPEPEPEPEPEEPEPDPEPLPPRRRVRSEPEPPDPASEPPPPAEETIVAFDNLVLTNEGGESDWATAQGSGTEREGPVGRPAAEVTGRDRRGSRNGRIGGAGEAPSGPPLLPLDALSRRPNPPTDLNAMLQRFYPREARRQGVEGRSQIRIRINANGSIRVLRTLSSTNEEFARACARMLRGTRWEPGLGPEGQPAATVTNFRCDFAVAF